MWLGDPIQTGLLSLNLLKKKKNVLYIKSKMFFTLIGFMRAHQEHGILIITAFVEYEWSNKSHPFVSNAGGGHFTIQYNKSLFYSASTCRLLPPENNITAAQGSGND